MVTSQDGWRTRRFRRLARSGFVVNGLIHLLIGGLAIGVAFGDSSGVAVNQSGALYEIGNNPVGRVLLWAAVIGLASLGLWQVTKVGLITDPSFLKKWGVRIVEIGKGVIYLFLALGALVYTLGGTTSSSEVIRRMTVYLLGSTFGVVVVLIIGLVGVGSGIGFVSIGIRRTFRKLIRVPTNWSSWLVLVLGIAGYLAKGIALAIVGVLAVAAALTGDATFATGLDGALRLLAQLPYGTIALAIVGFGLALYGFFLIARARLARL